MAMIKIKNGFKEAQDGVRGALGLGFLVIVGLISLGATVYAVTGGNITLSSGFNTVLHTLDTTLSGWFTTLSTTGTTVVSLVVVAVIVALFAVIMGMKKGKSGDSY